MKKRSSSSSAAKTAATLLSSPLPLTSPHHLTPKPFDFNLKGFNSSTKKKTVIATTSVMIQPRTTTRSSPKKPLSTISDLKDLVSSRSDSLKRHVDHSHSEIVKEFEASQSRITKRFKMHTQACQQMVDEAEKECKKLSDRINENAEILKSSYAEFIAEAQASAARVTKTAIPGLTQSMEKSIEGLRNRYGIKSASA